MQNTTDRLEEIKLRWAKDGLCSDSAVSYLMRRLEAAEAIIAALARQSGIVGDPEGTIAAWLQAKEAK